MVFVTGYGQMCNNILQFGHLYAWGKEHNMTVIAMRFCYKYPYFNINKHKHYHWFTYLFSKYGASLKLIPTVSFWEEQDVTQENINKLFQNKHSLVTGWQLRDYDAFLRHKDELKELFGFNEKVKKQVGKNLPKKKEQILRLGLHIRRGDYIRWMGGNYYYTDEEYINVIQKVLKLFPGKNIELVIVSNDKALQQELYKKKIPAAIYFMSGNPGEDLYALSTADYLIGPPSTFSLVASLYNDSPLYWILDKNLPLTLESFKPFEYLFKRII